MAVVLALPPQATLNDLDEAMKECVLTCCEPSTAYLAGGGRGAAVLAPSSSASLADKLAAGQLLYRIGRQPEHHVKIRLTSLGVRVVRVTPGQGPKLLVSRPPQLVCSHCHQRPASHILANHQGFGPVSLRVSPELMFLPPSVCSSCRYPSPCVSCGLRNERLKSCQRLSLYRLRSLPCSCLREAALDSTVEIDTTASSTYPRDSQDETAETCDTCGNKSDQDDDSSSSVSECGCDSCAMDRSTCSCSGCNRSSIIELDSSI